MGTVAANSIYLARTYCVCKSQMSVNTRIFKVTATTALASTEQGLVDAIDAALAPLYKAIMSVDASYNSTSIQKISPLPMQNYVLGSGNSGVGADASAVLAKQTAGVASLYTDTPRQGGRGRIYLPFPAKAMDDTGGYPTAGYRTDAASVAGFWCDDVTLTTGVLRTCTIRGGLFKEVTATFLPFTLYQIRRIWGTQKRRGDYGKPNIIL